MLVVIYVIYISPNQSIKHIIEFILENLLIYTTTGYAVLDEDLHEFPMILSGDFNVDFSKEKSKPLIDFLNNKLNLSISNDPNKSTT